MRPVGLLVAGALAAVLVGCSAAGSCSGAFTADAPADVAGATDPVTALQDWLDGDAPVGEAPEGAPEDSWTEEHGDDPAQVALCNGGWQVPTYRTTNGEWFVGTLECA